MADAMTVIWWIIVGGLAGWLASVLVQGRGLGVLGDILVGIVGAVIGGLIFGGTGSTLMSFVVALIGAIILLAIIKLVRRV